MLTKVQKKVLTHDEKVEWLKQNFEMWKHIKSTFDGDIQEELNRLVIRMKDACIFGKLSNISDKSILNLLDRARKELKAS